jgi:two-component system, OmpR family, sensor histidine kinase VicK
LDIPVLNYIAIAIVGYTHLPEKYSEKKDEILEVLKRNGNRLQKLTADILDFTRIESQTLKLNKQQSNLNDIILSIVQDNKNEVEKSTMPELRYHTNLRKTT